MKRQYVRDSLIAVLILGFLASPLALATPAYATSHELNARDPGTRIDERGRVVSAVPENASAFGAGAAGGLAACLIGPLLGIGAATAGPIVVPVGTIAVLVVDLPQATLKGSVVAKEGILDCIAGALAKAVIRQLTRSLINWVNSGFQGAPLFITDFGRFLSNIADEQIGEVIYGSPLAFLCSPFALQVRLTLQRSSFQRRVQCTLSQVVKNVDSFFKSFQDGGGWPAWLSITTEEQNNPYGATFATIFETDRRILTEQQRRLLATSDGYRSYSTCAQVGPGGACLRFQIKTPGVLIKEQVNKALGSPWDQLVAVDELNELADALLVALLQNVFGGVGGLAGVSETAYAGNASFSSGSFSSEVDRVDDAQTRALQDNVVAQLEEAISFEQKFIDSKRQTSDELVAASNRLNDLGNCYSQKLSGGTSLTDDERRDAENRKSNAWLGAQALLPRANAVDGTVATSTLTVQWLENYRTTVLGATNQQQVSDLLNAYLTYRSQGAFSSAFAVGEAERELASVREEMRLLNQSTDEKLSECYAFPNRP